MRRHGLDHWTEQLATDDWRVWFYTEHASKEAPGAAEPTPPAAAASGRTPAEAAVDGVDSDVEAARGKGDVVILDVRGLEPPEPMVQTLAALERLPAGATLVQINVRVPQFLLPMLEERGFAYHVREQQQDLVRVFIHHALITSSESETI
jgi:hypothetical protein